MQAAEKLDIAAISGGVVTGHDFSRADKDNQINVGPQPLQKSYWQFVRRRPFSAACIAGPGLLSPPAPWPAQPRRYVKFIDETSVESVGTLRQLAGQISIGRVAACFLRNSRQAPNASTL
jgi:hypothetical protein